MDEYTDDTCDNEGWYDFYVGINGFADNHMDSCIEFVVVNADSEDNEELYTIDLNGDEQAAVYARLDEQCRRYLGQSCEELLAEAKKRMEEDA
jgi:acylphosphatase